MSEEKKTHKIKKSKVQLCMCSAAGVQLETLLSLIGILKHCYTRTPHEYTWRMSMRTFIHMGRKRVAQMALDEGADYTVWFDDDMVWPSDIVHRLIAVSQVYDYPIVSGFYTTRKYPPMPLMYTKSGDAYRPVMPKEMCRDTLFECDATGFGALLIRRDVFEKVPTPWFELPDSMTEDIYFFRKVQELGIPIIIDPTIACGHKGEWGWSFPYRTEIADYVTGAKVYADEALEQEGKIIHKGEADYEEAAKELNNASTNESKEDRGRRGEDGEGGNKERQAVQACDVHLE